MGRVGSGVETREKSIRIAFVLDGEAIKERLTVGGNALPPTPANLKYAHRVAAEIRRRIALGNFEFAEFFPDSRRAKSALAHNTFGALADLWVKSKGQLAAATKNQYANAVAIWKRILGDGTPVQNLNHQVLAAKIGGYPWASAKSANNYLIALRGIMALEYHGKRAIENPMAGIENLPVVRKPPDPLSAVERDLVLDEMSKRYDPRVSAYFVFAFYTGMRPEEMIALRWGDIDWRKRTAHVGRVRTFRGSERDGSKTHTERDVDLVSVVMNALQAMKAYTFMKRGTDQEDPSANIFENPVTGKAWHDERSQRDHYWAPTLKRLGIRHRRAYNTRHTYATAALMAGLKPAYIARQMGHATTAMLFNVYGKWIDGADKDTERQALEAALCGPNSSHGSTQEKSGST